MILYFRGDWIDWELRPVANGQERLREAQKHGLKRL